MMQIKTDTDGRVVVVNYTDKLIDGFIRVDSIPKPEERPGKYPVMYYLYGAIVYEYMDIPPMPEEDSEQKLAEAIETKIAEITAYDKSDAVNGLTYDGCFLWLSREDRLALTDRFTREMAKGLEKTNLFYNGEAIEVTPQQGLMLVQAVSDYADKCFDNTQKHKATVQALTTVEEVEAYDYTTGYPEKLNLTY